MEQQARAAYEKAAGLAREAADQEARNMMKRETAGWSAELNTFRSALDFSKHHQQELENELRAVKAAYHSSLMLLRDAGISPQRAEEGRSTNPIHISSQISALL